MHFRHNSARKRQVVGGGGSLDFPFSLVGSGSCQTVHVPDCTWKKAFLQSVASGFETA